MSAVIPTSVVRHVLDAPPDTARVACNRIAGSDPDAPCLVIVANSVGTVVLLQMIDKAIQNAPDEETKAGWKGFASQMSNAIQGAITS